MSAGFGAEGGHPPASKLCSIGRTPWAFWWQIAGGGFVVLQGELHVRSAVLATNFSQPSELFEKFPHRDVFVAGKDGPGK